MENKNKENKLWFKAKNYGWGWYPITWQGWLITGVYTFGIAFTVSRVIVITENTTDTAGTFLWNFLPKLVILSAIMIWICYKTGEKPEWRWNGKK